MRGSFKIATFFGIPVFIHWSFSLLFLFVFYVAHAQDAGWKSVLFLSGAVIALFTCVIMHEYGHALSAKYFGVGTRDITILPIGGVARLDRLPEKPFQEFIVAIAGPLVNVVIFSFLIAVLYFAFDVRLDFGELLGEEPNDFLRPLSTFLVLLAQGNFVLFFFNLIPAFPMDGGRVLRALLSVRLGRTKATFLAATLGQVVAICFVLRALSPLLGYILPEDNALVAFMNAREWEFQPVLAFIGFFIFYTAYTEYQHVKMDERMSRHTVGNIVRAKFTAFRTSTLIGDVANLFSKGEETNFLVFDDEGTLRGILQDEDLMDAVRNRQFDALVSSYTTYEYAITNPYRSIKDVYNQMLTSGQYMMPVLSGDALIGVVDMHMIHEFMQTRTS